jgi:hypothetical protein
MNGPSTLSSQQTETMSITSRARQPVITPTPGEDGNRHSAVAAS